MLQQHGELLAFLRTAQQERALAGSAHAAHNLADGRAVGVGRVMQESQAENVVGARGGVLQGLREGGTHPEWRRERGGQSVDDQEPRTQVAAPRREGDAHNGQGAQMAVPKLVLSAMNKGHARGSWGNGYNGYGARSSTLPGDQGDETSVSYAMYGTSSGRSTSMGGAGEDASHVGANSIGLRVGEEGAMQWMSAGEKGMEAEGRRKVRGPAGQGE